MARPSLFWSPAPEKKDPQIVGTGSAEGVQSASIASDCQMPSQLSQEAMGSGMAWLRESPHQWHQEVTISG